MSEKRFFTTLANDEYTLIQKKGNPRSTYLKYSEVVDLLNKLSDENTKLHKKVDEQQELIEELQVSDEMGWKRAEHFEKKCPKELHNKKMYIKRLEYKVQKFKEENEQLRQQLKEKEEDEQLYANEIVKLNKEAKEVLDFKSLGGDY